MISAAAADSTERVIFLVLTGVVVVGGLTLTIVRVLRSAKPREEQMARLAADSRGYSLIDHRFGKYYEFVFTPHQPGRYA